MSSKTRIKIFHDLEGDGAEEQVNLWLKVEDVKIVDIKFALTENGYNAVMVIYEQI